jgi:hypothetical protein
VCGAFKHDELSWTERLGNRAGSAFDIAQIRIAALIKRRWNTNDDAVGLRESAQIGSRIEFPVANELR